MKRDRTESKPHAVRYDSITHHIERVTDGVNNDVNNDVNSDVNSTVNSDGR